MSKFEPFKKLEEDLESEIFELKDLILFLKSCAKKKFKKYEVDEIFHNFYRDENRFKLYCSKIYQKLDPEMIASLRKATLKQAAMMYLYDYKTHSFMPISIKKAIKKITKIIAHKKEELNNIKDSDKRSIERLEQAKALKEKRKLEQKEKFILDHPNGLDKDVIEQQSNILFTNVEDVIAKMQELINARFDKVQSDIDSVPYEEIKESMQESTQIFRSLFERNVISANEFINQMKAMYTQLASEDFEAIRVFWNSSMEIAIMNGIDAIALDDSKAEKFLTAISHLDREIFDDSPDLQCALYWWLKALTMFYQSLARVVKRDDF